METDTQGNVDISEDGEIIDEDIEQLSQNLN